MEDMFDKWLDSRPADEVPSDGELLPGTRVGACKVVALLGRGGFAEVYRGEDADGCPVAVKILQRLDEKSRARFELETKILLQVRHPNFPRMLSFGSCGERPYVVMELLKPFEMPRGDRPTARFLQTIVRATGALHRQGYVHRDIKPDNVLMRPNGDPVLVDFGLACPLSQVARERNALSVEGPAKVGVGTYGYSAPEQFSGQDVGREADVHAIGMLIRKCFDGELPKCWRNIYLTATNSDPSIRYRTVEKLGEAIRRRHWRKVVAIVVGALVLTLTCVLAWGPVSESLRDSKDPVILPKDMQRY